MKFDKCVHTVVLGFQSINNTIDSSQFIYRDGEKRQNFFCGKQHCPVPVCVGAFLFSDGTVLDMSGDPVGTYV